MDVVAIMALVAKGLSVLEIGISAGKEVAPVLTALKNLVTTPAVTVTQAQMDAADKILDDQLTEFNAPI